MENRKIKFRGKRRRGGEWVYGYFWKSTYGTCYIKTKSGEDFDVNEKTVSQGTELKDKNGKELYFGDLVKLIDDEYIWEVKRDDFGIPVFEANAYNLGKPYTLIDFGDYFSENGNETFEIIGNIYNNNIKDLA